MSIVPAIGAGMRNIVKKVVSSFGIEIHRVDQGRRMYAMDLLDLLRHSQPASDLDDFLRYAAANAHRSNSQLFQDLFVLHTLGEKRGGYFVEFGAADGVFLSNTLLLERDYGWSGIAAEPSARWRDALKANRKCVVDERCVWNVTGETLTFSETPDAEFSTLSQFKAADHIDRSAAKDYQVQTVSLNDLLSEHRAPAVMDYLSIDTEGSEPIVLKSLDFGKWSFRVITVEHNFVTSARKEIHALLTSKGYRRALADISRWDDWYVLG
jgi:FkbM family methyltransferase